MGSKVTKIHYDIFGQAKGGFSKVALGFKISDLRGVKEDDLNYP